MVILAGHGEGGGCKTERGSKGPGPALTAGVSAHYSTVYFCSGKMFRKGNENVLAWLWGNGIFSFI